MLSQKARYALHAALFLASRDGTATADEIAASEGIPRKYLEHVMAALKAGGLVSGKRGPAGGYVLSRSPHRVTMAEILRAIDGPLALAPCASLTAYRPCPDCKSIETCAIRPVLLAVRDTTAMLMEGTSLAQMLSGQGPSFL